MAGPHNAHDADAAAGNSRQRRFNAKCLTMRRFLRRDLIFGTVAERKRPESLTLSMPGFVHATCRVNGGSRPLHQALMAANNRVLCVNFLTSESNQIGRRVNGTQTEFAGQFVFAVFCTDTNFVASMTPVPIGVGITMRNGASTRVPAIGANQISISLCAARYLIA